jgi:tetratricopeptide (TPR) repeat protein
MIIDNADDLSVLSYLSTRRKKRQDDDAVPAAGHLSDFLPQSPNGSILITSRSRDVAFRLTGSASDIIEVKPMDQAHALDLLKKKLETDFEEEIAEELLDALDYMPLAITQAAAYIRQRAPRMTSSKYLQDLCKSDGDRANLLKKDVGDSRRDGRASNSIIATWGITFEYIRQQRPSAARLLALMSFFDRQAIADSLLDHRYQETDDVEYDFEEDIFTLSSYSLIGTKLGGNEFEMHRLVQFSTKTWLELNDELEKWKDTFTTILDKAFPEPVYENWTTCGNLFPHAELSLASRPINNKSLLHWASILSKAAAYAQGVGNHNLTEKMIRTSVQVFTKTLGEDHSETLASTNVLVLVLEHQGLYEEVETLTRRALQRCEETLGSDHSYTQTWLNNLAMILYRQGKYEEAEILHRRALEGSERVLGKEHPFTLLSVNNLAMVLQEEGRYKEAEILHRRALEERERTLGKEHPTTLISVNNLATVLGKKGRYEEAEILYRRALEGSERVRGKEHPFTLLSVNNLATVLQEQGRYEEAEILYRRALEGSERVLGKEHPTTLTSVNNLATVLGKEGRYEEAEILYRRALEGRERI